MWAPIYVCTYMHNFSYTQKHNIFMFLQFYTKASSWDTCQLTKTDLIKFIYAFNIIIISKFGENKRPKIAIVKKKKSSDLKLMKYDSTLVV